MSDDEEDVPKRTRSYVEEAFRQIEAKPDVSDIIILNQSGNPIKTSMEMSAAIQCAGLYETLREKVQMGIKRIDDEDELVMLRVRTKMHEVLITPDEKITVLVVQNTKDRFVT